MTRVFPYYDLTATIRYGDKPWPEYPHVHFANLKLSDDSLHSFTRLYGPLFDKYECTWPLPKTKEQSRHAVIRNGWHGLMNMQMVANAHRTLREAWRDSPEYLKAIAGHDPEQDAVIYAPIQPVISVTDTGIELIAPDVWSFARLAFLRDHALGKTKICANPDCITPYFIQGKQGQLFCCHKCAVLVNVRRFRREQETKPKIKTRSTKKRAKK